MEEFRNKISLLRKRMKENHLPDLSIDALDSVYLYLSDQREKGLWNNADAIILKTFNALADEYITKTVSLETLEKAENQLYEDLKGTRSGAHKFFSSIFTQMGIGAIVGAVFFGLLALALQPTPITVLGLILLGTGIGLGAAVCLHTVVNGHDDSTAESKRLKYSFWSGNNSASSAFESMESHLRP